MFQYQNEKQSENKELTLKHPFLSFNYFYATTLTLCAHLMCPYVPDVFQYQNEKQSENEELTLKHSFFSFNYFYANHLI
jgi:hypothetical protein